MSAPAAGLPNFGQALWTAAEGLATGRAFRFDAECEEALKSFLKQGALQLAEDGSLGNTGKMTEARASIERLVEHMMSIVVERQRVQKVKGSEAVQHNRLTVEVFQTARRWFCPCYPFC